ncbi:MAG TPA: extracellular solute-binding protein [Candidatus Binatia bacterium]|nr:extracellular solute-binding protein [Candidatus Binatia bacterium]
MRQIKAINIGLLAVLIAVGWAGFARAGAMEDLIAGAKKEGVIDFYGPSSLTPQGASMLEAAFNKKYGLNTTLKLHPSLNMTRDVGKLVGMAASGVAPEWDMMVVTDAHYATLWLRKLLQPYDYKSAGVDPQVIHYDNGSVTFANQIVLPAYNNKVVAAKDVPTKWEDLLDPKWKDGKLGVSTATHHFARLAVGAWGEEKTTKFVKAISDQKPVLGRLAELYNRLLLGEISIAFTLTDSNINEAKKSGAPVVFAETIQPVISPAYQAGVLKGAAHPMTGHLFSIFLTSDEAQDVWEKYNGQTSAFVPGTNTYKFLKGKQALFMDQKQAKTVDKLARQYGKMLGFNR